jgi:hypothetical protein
MDPIQKEVTARGITRLAHFTSVQNIVHIYSGDEGIQSTASLADKLVPFTATDTARLDQHPDHICCSIEFPNAWYLDRIRSKPNTFQDWVLLFVSPHYLWGSGTLFCPRNAAAGAGVYVGEGAAAFRALFAPAVSGAWGQTRTRAPRQLPCCPTDDQAEVLVPRQIQKSDILAVAVPTTSQAEAEHARMELLGVAGVFPIVVAPVLFQKHTLSQAVRSGIRPEETVWQPRM